MKAKLRRILESDKFIGICIGFMIGIVFHMLIRAMFFWTYGYSYPMGY